MVSFESWQISIIASRQRLIPSWYPQTRSLLISVDRQDVFTCHHLCYCEWVKRPSWETPTTRWKIFINKKKVSFELFWTRSISIPCHHSASALTYSDRCQTHESSLMLLPTVPNWAVLLWRYASHANQTDLIGKRSYPCLIIRYFDKLDWSR